MQQNGGSAKSGAASLGTGDSKVLMPLRHDRVTAGGLCLG